MTLTNWNVCRTAAIVAVVVIVCIGGSSVRAAIVGPYTPDANTLQLWHMDDGTAATSAANAVGGGLTMQGVLNGATLGNTAVSGFGTSLDVSAGANAIVSSGNPPAVPPHRAILLGAPALSTSNGGADNAVDDVTLNFRNASTGAFTLEAMIKFSSSYDPAAAFRSTAATAAPGTNNGVYPMEIIAAEGDAAASGRPFQFRFDQLGFNAGGNTLAKLELNGIASGGQFFALVPTSGPNAINNTDWFHVAVTYNGNENTANNLTFYWTKVDPSVGAANALTTVNNTGATPTTWFNDPAANTVANDFAIGNEARSNGTGLGEGENFFGLIDEVRISDIARNANQFIFAVPEIPGWAASAVCLLGIVGVSQVKRRRAKPAAEND